VGYTNSGKSCLMNSLTHKWVLTENKLFATLWTSVGKMYIETPDFRGREVLLNDTIWFIRELPPNLIKAFSSTLEDSIESDLLLHVIDASDPKVLDKIKVVEDTLIKIWAVQKRINVFNKIDLIDEKTIKSLKKEFKHLNPVFISAFDKIWFDDLKRSILNQID
jgi:GTP-binding protein HflX